MQWWDIGEAGKNIDEVRSFNISTMSRNAIQVMFKSKILRGWSSVSMTDFTTEILNDQLKPGRYLINIILSNYNYKSWIYLTFISPWTLYFDVSCSVK